MFESGTTAFVVVIAVLLLAAMIMVRRRETVFRVPATVESIRAIVARVSQSAEQARLTEQAIFQCKLATDEACANIIEHAYGESGGEIEVILKVRDGLHIHLIDFGNAYDPSQVPYPAIGESIETMSPGGLGLYLMRSVMDEVHYEPGPQGNRLTMIKRR